MTLSYVRVSGGVSIRFGDYELAISFHRPNIVRVIYGKGKADHRSLTVIREEFIEPTVVAQDNSIELYTEVLRVRVRDNGVLEFADRNGVFLTEVERGLGDNGLGGFWSLQVFMGRGLGFYGLGQHQGVFNYRNHDVYLVQRNPTETALPILISNVGYGVMWDHYSLSRVSIRDVSTSLSRIEFWSEDVDSVSYYVIYGPSIDGVVSGYRWLTGKAPMLPKWAFGYWQSRERYRTQEEVLSIAREFRRRGIPIDVIVQDWQYWGKYGWNAFKFDESNYPDPRSMVDELHRMGIRLVISIWPIFGQKTDIYREFRDKGYLIPGSLNYDPFNEGARKAYWDGVNEAFAKIGIDGWWLDASEPELNKPRDPQSDLGTWTFYTGLRDSQTAMGRGSRFLNAYPLMHTKAVYEGQRSSYNRRVVILTRSAFLGQQRHSAITWSGDVHHDWGVFAGQIPAGLNFSVSGIPYWTTDTGGFFSGDPLSEAYSEVFVRWLQWSTFCPVMRVHGTWYPKEPWMFRDDTYKVIVEYIRFRYRLIPYIYSLAWMVYNEDYTIMRPLFMDFPNDEYVINIGDQYMFGPFIMVSPVTTPARKRRVYLPRGVEWFDFWSGRRITGGVYIDVDAPLDKIPLHVKAGSVLPLGPVKDNTDGVEVNIELRVYPGPASEFRLYFDDGETYGYERGEYCIVPIKWSGDGTLTIGDAQGAYCRSIGKITFNVVTVNEGKGVGVDESRPDASIEYEGRTVSIKLAS